MMDIPILSTDLLKPYLNTEYVEIPVDMQVLIQKCIDQLVDPVCSQTAENFNCYEKAWNNLTPDKRKELVFVYETTQILVGYHKLVPGKQRWEYWAKKPFLLARDAIPLMNGLDPDCWEDYNDEQKIKEFPSLPEDMVTTIIRFLEMAESDGGVKKKPVEWLVWGRSHGLDEPTLKSEEWISEPDVCMWSLFASAVYKLEGFSEMYFTPDTYDSDKKKDCNIKDAPPGKLPKVAIGKLAVKAAWYIECETGRKVSARETIDTLQSWVGTNKDDEEILCKKVSRGVQWMTGKSSHKTYDIEACGQTLKRWRESYQ